MDETPVIASGVKEKIRENMVFAVEPKIALPELGMVGTENTYRIGPDGPVCLTGGPQPLRVVR
jgi:Xaa-Pro aminopeptidase